jgi:hypothetical protein
VSRGVYRILKGENLRETNHLEGLKVDGRIIVKWLVRQWDVRA